MRSTLFVESCESSGDDENDSATHKRTNEAIIASSAGGMGRAAALGMDVGSIEESIADEVQIKNSHAWFHSSFILKKKMKSLIKKTKEVREHWSS